MKVCIAFPPLQSQKGIPLLSQNRQFQWSKAGTVIYPVLPASAATLLHSKGHEVSWLDGIAEKWSLDTWFEQLGQANPDLMCIESKTPVIKKHWKIIDKIKNRFPHILVVLAGDHVTALPDESFKNSKVDFILSGGNFDTALLSLVTAIEAHKKDLPKLWKDEKKPNLNLLPTIDRNLTKWKLYAYNNGNFKYFPATYTMAGRDCWWRVNGGCTFCSWTSIFPQFSVRSVANVLDEVGGLIELGVKEIFDDTGTFMIGKWLTEFCQGMIDRGYHKRIVFGCNMRFGYLKLADYQLMARAGFRFLLFGLESANQNTIDHLNKGTKVELIENELSWIKKANTLTKGDLSPHITCMVGYPWESKDDAEKTVALCRRFFSMGLIRTLQATVMIPYPGTELFRQAKEKGWLKTLDWNRYDMKEPILKTDLTNHQIFGLTQGIYLSAFSPQFIFKTLISIRSIADIKIILVKTRQFAGRLLDFKP